jgi:hypothetical protein
MNEIKDGKDRPNARKSPGPRSESGKATSAQNARKHGLSAQHPFVRGKAEDKAFKKHCNALISDLSTRGYLQSQIVIRIADATWNLECISRYRSQLFEADLATEQHSDAHTNDFNTPDPEELATAQAVERLLKSLTTVNQEKKIECNLANATILSIREHVNPDLHSLSIPGCPDDPAEQERFDNWTVAHICRVIEVYAEAEEAGSEELWKYCVAAAEKDRRSLEEEEREWKLCTERERQKARMSRHSQILDLASRYESKWQNDLIKMLGVLAVQQRARAIVELPPAAEDAQKSGKS